MPSWTATEQAHREEQLDWLHLQHDALQVQTALLERVSERLEEIATHTHRLYIVATIVLVCWGVAVGLVVIGFIFGLSASWFG